MKNKNVHRFLSLLEQAPLMIKNLSTEALIASNFIAPLTTPEIYYMALRLR